MTKKKKKWGLILAPMAVIAICVSLIAGSTLALFTNESKVNVAVTTAKVEVTATVDNLKTYSGEWDGTGYISVEQSGAAFANGGFASVSGNSVTVNAMSPFDKVSFDITVTNKSTIDIKYRTAIKNISQDNVLDITVGGNELVKDDATDAYVNSWVMMNKAEGENYPTEKFTVVIALGDAGNDVQGMELGFDYCVEAVQGNAHVEDPTLDENTVAIYTAKDLRDFSASVNDGNQYEQKTVKLMNDIDLKGVPFEPIGSGIYATANTSPTGVADPSFKGLFEGNGKTISNLVVEADHNATKAGGEQYAGLFGHLAGRVQNVNITKADIKSTHYAGAIAGAVLSAVGDHGYCWDNDLKPVQIVNCTVENSNIESTPCLNKEGKYDNGDKVGGIVGYLANYNIGGKWTKTGYLVENNTVSDTTVKGYRDLGGLIGYAWLWRYTGKNGVEGICDPNVIVGNTLKNVTVIQDFTNEYKDVTAVLGTVGERIGTEMKAGEEPEGYNYDFGTVENVFVKTIANSIAEAETLVELAKEQNAKRLATSALQAANTNLAVVLAEGDYTVTPDNAQFVLDLIGDNSSILFTEGNYGTLTLGSSMASMYDRKYIDYYSHHRLTRRINDLIINCAADVTVQDFRLGSTLNNTDNLAQEDKMTNPVIGDKSLFYAKYFIDGLTINGMTLENGIVMSSEGWDTVELSNIKISGCRTTNNEDHLSDASSVVNNNRFVDIRKATNVVVMDCEIINRYQGVYLQGVKNATVQGCRFSYTHDELQSGHKVHNAIAFQDYSNGAAYCSGELKVLGNTFTNIKERVIRFGSIFEGNIIIAVNVITNCGDEKGSLSKIQNKADGVTFELLQNGDNFHIDINGSQEIIQ